VRVVIVFDMEGTSHIGDFHELYPMFPEYWDRGRKKLTNDISAAARGLFAGGATEVVVMNHHGAGDVEWPNAVPGDLPDGVQLVDWDQLAMRDEVDAMFHVGAHARGGSPTFSSHTILPGLRLRVGQELLSESHWWAWTGDVPVLGIVGSAGLEVGLSSLSDVPFLAVQTGHGRASARPVFASPDQTAEAIQAFAMAAVRDGGAQRSRQPRDVILEASVQNADEAALAITAAGWSRTSQTEFRIEASAWRGDGEPIEHAIGAVAEATWKPYAHTFDGLDPTSEASGLAFPVAQRAETEAFLTAWTNDRTVEWITPQSATRWEGMTVGQTRTRDIQQR
jgi:D-amino peptidase